MRRCATTWRWHSRQSACQKSRAVRTFLLVKFASTSIEFQLLCRRGPVSVEGALQRFKTAHPGWKLKTWRFAFQQCISIRSLIPCWYSNVFGHQAQSGFESKCFVLGKWHSQHLPWRTFRHFKTVEDLPTRPQNPGSTKIYRGKVGFSRKQHNRFWGIRPSLSGAIHCASAHMKAHFGPRRVACRAAKKNRSFLRVLQFWVIPNLHISCFFWRPQSLFQFCNMATTAPVRSFIHFCSHGQMALCQATLGTSNSTLYLEDHPS